MVKVCHTYEDLQSQLSGAGGKLVVVDFYATWCGPCKRIAPKIEAWSGEMSDVVFLKVDVDENGEAAEKYEIEAMPTFKLFKGGEVIATVVGGDENKLHQAILGYK